MHTGVDLHMHLERSAERPQSLDERHRIGGGNQIPFDDLPDGVGPRFGEEEDRCGDACFTESDAFFDEGYGQLGGAGVDRSGSNGSVAVTVGISLDHSTNLRRRYQLGERRHIVCDGAEVDLGEGRSHQAKEAMCSASRSAVTVPRRRR